jgi:mono/diheme cytochrome c family protein
MSKRRLLYQQMHRCLAILLALLVPLPLGCGRPTHTDGKTLFDSTCATCHGRDGHGTPAAKLQLAIPDMNDAAFQTRLSDEDIKRTVREGSKSKKMPPFGDYFTEPQLDALVQYVRGFGRPPSSE